MEQVHKQYIEALEQGVSKTFAELYLAKFEGLYNLSGDKRSYLNKHVKGALREIDESKHMLDDLAAMGKNGDYSVER